MPRRVDTNQAGIVQVLRQIGATVQTLAMVGRGVPDLLVGYHGRNFLLEVKDGSKPPSARPLTPRQTLWHKLWRGEICVVTSQDEAIKCVTTPRKGGK